MLPIEEMSEAIDIQDGVNTAVIELLKRFAWTITAKLPTEHRSDFHELIFSLSRDEEAVEELSEIGKQSFEHVVEVIAGSIQQANDRFS